MVALALEARNLRKRYGTLEALKGLDFAVPEGEIVAFLGPNSAGKSTTLKIFAGLLPATSGEAYLCGIPIASRSEKTRRLVGYMPELNPLPEDVTVEDYLLFRAQLKGLRRKGARSRVEKVAGLCELKGRLMERPIGVLSRGVRQRVGIAEALLGDPPVLLLDEPTIGLDPHQVIALRELIASMRGQHTIFVSTHILSEAEALASRVLILNKGERVAFGTPDELREAYQTQERWVFEVRLSSETFCQMLRVYGGELKKSSQRGGLGSHEVVFASAEGAHALAAELVGKEGGLLEGFRRLTPSLETIFIEATARKEEL
jgi:ABC-2 type transport system ATP-binding protein